MLGLSALKAIVRKSKNQYARWERERRFEAARQSTTAKTKLPFRLVYAFREHTFDVHSGEMALHLLKTYEPVEVICYGAGERERGKQHLTTGHFMRAIDEFRPDAIFSFDKFLLPEEMKALKARGIILFGTSTGFNSFDADVFPQSQVMEMLRMYDAYGVAYAPHVARLVNAGVRAEEFALWGDTDLFRPLGLERDIDVLFVGTNTGLSRPYRQPILERLGKAVTLTIAGPTEHFTEIPGAKLLGPVTSKVKINELFNRAKIVLGSDRLIEEVAASNRKPGQIFFYDDVGYQVKDRTPCVLASGACYLVEDHPENRRLFKDGEELVLWSDAEDLIVKTKRLLADPALRRRIGEQGRARVIRDYSVAVRAKHMIERIEQSRE